ncbi:hypothetical protein [Aquipseudomonas guryensis]|jgi:hypothetical protein|uniref:Uncharacterized protein n=1 Tax=Aquipseudomonas guryensis TaxID=2759165 RepID=A0A7W4DF06_9GAMM|nr:hypothetical protein [Pseudomonas guryensis]MBB1521374.1 hypothetical protein [Pseudomonas guryensis]
MPAISVTLNGNLIAKVSTGNLNILSVRVSGDILADTFATIDFSGGRYEPDSESKHLIWLNEQVLQPNDQIEVSLHEQGETSLIGKTIEELYPEPPQAHDESITPEEIFSELSQRKAVRSGFRFEIVTPTGEVLNSRTNPGDYCFGFTTIWNGKNPDRAKTWLTSNTLERIALRENGSDHARLTLQLGQSIFLRVCA